MIVLKILCGIGVYLLTMFSLTVVVAAGVSSGLRNYFDKYASKKIKEENIL